MLIQQVFQRVAEDFAPFDVDVTTQDPGVDALRRTTSSDQYYGVRAVISPTSGWLGVSAGGVAYVGSFQWTTDTPCFSFSSSLANNERYIAEATSHEVGHTLGLYHDGKTDGTEYYSGHGVWAPIMGVGYYKSVTQWSKGEYALANNTEDDLQVMQNYGAFHSADDHGDSLTNSTAVPGTEFSIQGIIGQSGDADVFSFACGNGSFSVSPAMIMTRA